MLGWVCMRCCECTRLQQLRMLTLPEQGAEIESLKARVKQYADYDEVKRELGIMKVCVIALVGSCFLEPECCIFPQFVEFGEDDGDEAPMPDPNADKANLQQGQSLEGLLMAKNRKLLEELTKIRVRGFDAS